MKKFNEFLVEQSLNQKIAYVAYLMAESVDNPDEFIQTWFEDRYPELHENVWGGVKNAASQMWQGMKSGGQAFARDAWGPKAKFDSAIKTLNNLSQYLKRDPQLANWSGTTGNNKLVDELDAMIQKLNSLQQHIPQNQIQGGKNNWGNSSQNTQTPPPFTNQNFQTPTQNFTWPTNP